MQAERRCRKFSIEMPRFYVVKGVETLTVCGVYSGWCRFEGEGRTIVCFAAPDLHAQLWARTGYER